MSSNLVTIDAVMAVLAQIPDPEVPVITITELGIVRDVDINNNTVTVKITPTYTGCPAMKQIESDIRSVLKLSGIENVKVETVYSPAWTTDWISDEAKEKLREYGIAPPEKNSPDKGLLSIGGPKVVACPRCKSTHTQMISQFGSTACKALYKCLDCLEPFDYFKCI